MFAAGRSPRDSVSKQQGLNREGTKSPQALSAPDLHHDHGANFNRLPDAQSREIPKFESFSFSTTKPQPSSSDFSKNKGGPIGGGRAGELSLALGLERRVHNSSSDDDMRSHSRKFKDSRAQNPKSQSKHSRHGRRLPGEQDRHEHAKHAHKSRKDRRHESAESSAAAKEAADRMMGMHIPTDKFPIAIDIEGDASNLHYRQLAVTQVPRHHSWRVYVLTAGAADADGGRQKRISRYCTRKNMKLLRSTRALVWMPSRLLPDCDIPSGSNSGHKRARNSAHTPVHRASDGFIPLESECNQNSDSSADEMVPAGVEVTVEEHLIAKARKFNRAVQDNPANFKNWLRLAEFQDEYMALVSRSAQRQILEKKRSILSNALKECPNVLPVLDMYLDVCTKQLDNDETLSVWNAVVSKYSHDADVWLRYLRYRMSHLQSFSVLDVRAAFMTALSSCASAIRGSPNAEVGSLLIFEEYLEFERQTGHIERAVSALQAMLELNLFASQEQSKTGNLKAILKHFWESQAPRVGEAGSKGLADFGVPASMQKVHDQVGSEGLQPAPAQTVDEFLTQMAQQSFMGSSDAATKQDPHSSPSDAKTDIESDEDDGISDTSSLASWDNDDGTVLCELCKEVKALVSCEQCNCQMCGACSNRVHKATVTRHNVIPLNKNAVKLSEDEQKEQQRLERAKTQQLFSHWMHMEVERGRTHVLSLRTGRSEDEDDEIELDPERHITWEMIECCIFIVERPHARALLAKLCTGFLDGCLPPFAPSSLSMEQQRSLGICAARRFASGEGGIQLLNLLSSVGTGPEEWWCWSDKAKDISRRVLSALCVKFPDDFDLSLAAMICELRYGSGIKGARNMAKALLKRRPGSFGLWTAYAQTLSHAGEHQEAVQVALQACKHSAASLPRNAQQPIEASTAKLFQCAAMLAAGWSYRKQDFAFEFHRANLKQVVQLQSHSCMEAYFDERIEKLTNLAQSRSLPVASVMSPIDSSMIATYSLYLLSQEGFQVADGLLSFIVDGCKASSTPPPALESVAVLRSVIVGAARKLASGSLVQHLEALESSCRLCPCCPSVWRAAFASPLTFRRMYRIWISVWEAPLSCDKPFSLPGPSPTLWLTLFTAFQRLEQSAWKRVLSILERALKSPSCAQSGVLWGLLLRLSVDYSEDKRSAISVFYRAVEACPWAKHLWSTGIRELSSVLQGQELRDVVGLMKEKELRLTAEVEEAQLELELAEQAQTADMAAPGNSWE